MRDGGWWGLGSLGPLLQFSLNYVRPDVFTETVVSANVRAPDVVGVLFCDEGHDDHFGGVLNRTSDDWGHEVSEFEFPVVCFHKFFPSLARCWC